MLLIASYVFYGWWDWRFLSLLFISTIIDFIIAKSMGKCGENRQGTKKALLITSLAVNLGILGFFKYLNFFAQSFERVVAPLGLHPDFVTLNILLPVGISFYTFQTMAYVIDVYRSNEKPCKNFWDFALYVAFFPQLVAGPIERSTNLIPQFQKPRAITRAMIYSACQLILMGYFKKVFIADGVAPIVNECFATPDKFGGITLFFGAVLFMIQVYGDFSGYTDIARGVARMFGIEVMLNFKQPFLSANITEFWQRWHISLMLWFKDYVYIPLLNALTNRSRYVWVWMYFSLMTIMFLSGLWHGASMHFVIWGILHGILLCIHAAIRSKRLFQFKNASKEWKIFFWLLSIVCTFTLVVLVQIFFRASSCSAACHYLYLITRGGHAGFADVWLYVKVYGLCVLLLDVLCYYQNSEVPFTEKWWMPVRGFAYACMLFLLVFIGENDVQPFIYFQF
jgi:D-alanyl-lipoteichoic acid acyltransferase DltB (MBOAT superfamily)